MKLLQILAPLALLGIVGCKNLPPEEFVGAWEFDEERTEQAILNSDLDEEGKLKASSSYIHMNRGDVLVISDDGYWWLAEAPEQTKTPLDIQRIEKGTIYILEPDQGVREIGKEYEPTIFKISVSGNLLEIHEEQISFNTFYKRRSNANKAGDDNSE
ncbi:MAG: hypothetical protein CML13_12640 [Puniceicoccaceae bacterium]|nr:hypothetical protein [Puniceicoccaceae bacterium]|tara:strand:- start:1282 stop:1752 length:471 start_codon:yes stop_codon:yes gene_type:complete